MPLSDAMTRRHTDRVCCCRFNFNPEQWTGRSLTLLDPTYATKYIPIIASVSEHQPTTWTSFFFDLHILVSRTRHTPPSVEITRLMPEADAPDKPTALSSDMS